MLLGRFLVSALNVRFIVTDEHRGVVRAMPKIVPNGPGKSYFQRRQKAAQHH
jgi:hypothetical protein